MLPRSLSQSIFPTTFQPLKLQYYPFDNATPLTISSIAIPSSGTARYNFSGSPNLTTDLVHGVWAVGMYLICSSATDAANNGTFLITNINDASDYIDVVNANAVLQAGAAGTCTQTGVVQNIAKTPDSTLLDGFGNDAAYLYSVGGDFYFIKGESPVAIETVNAGGNTTYTITVSIDGVNFSAPSSGAMTSGVITSTTWQKMMTDNYPPGTIIKITTSSVTATSYYILVRT